MFEWTETKYMPSGMDGRTFAMLATVELFKTGKFSDIGYAYDAACNILDRVNEDFEDESLRDPEPSSGD